MPVLQKDLLEKYVSAVMNAPAALGLTATESPVEFWERHVLDALKMIELLPKNFQEAHLKVVDVGSGNGVPGIPAAIAFPNWSICLVDSNNKKCGFLDMFCKSNAIKNVRVIARHAEDYAREEGVRDSFDLGFARALSKLPVALELTLPFIKREGLLMIPHGSSYESELISAEKTMKELGAVLQSTTPYQINPDVSFTALTFLKTHQTSDKYPRKTGQARKRPL